MLCISQIEASTSPPPPPGIPRAFDRFAVPGRREFDYQSLPGGGEFDPHEFELYPRFDVQSMGSLHMASYDGVRGVRGFWLQGKCLNKLCAVFESILNF